MHKYRNYAVYLAVFGFLLWIGLINLDPDLWWRLRIGKDILQTGIPHTDPYSYSMPSYHFVDHEWLTHVLFYLGSTVSQYLNVIVASILATATLIIVSRTKLSGWKYINLLFILPLFLFFFGVKPQVVSWFLLALLLYILQKGITKYTFVILSLLFLIWANMHGGFVYGLGILLLYICTHSKVPLKHRLVLLVTSAAATLINPYGIRMWNEVLVSALDPTLRFAVVEWRPIFLNMSLAVWFITPLYLTLFFRSFKKLSVFEISTFIITFLLGVSSSRNYPLWIIVASPIVTHSVELFWKSLPNKKEVKRRAKLVTIFAASLASVIFCVNTYSAVTELTGRQETNYYPSDAVSYLKAHTSPGNLFSVYSWGGYLINKYPEKKVFIDGRMPSWKQPAKANESSNALKDFYAVLAGEKNIKRYFAIYQVDTVMIPASYIKDPVIRKATRINPFLNQLKKNNFIKVYEDSTALVFRTKTGWR